MEQFLEHQTNIIRRLAELKDNVVNLSGDASKKDLIKLKFIISALQGTIDLSKHLILKAIAILSGFKVDEIHDSNILLRDKDIDNYIL